MKKKLKSLFLKFNQLLVKNNLQKKFLILYFFCVILPLIVTDSLIIKSVYDGEVRSIQSNMEYLANLYKESLSNILYNDRTLANSVNMNGKLNHFLNQQYKTPYDFYCEYYSEINGTFMGTLAGLSNATISVYADNDTILEGVYLKRLSSAEEENWYKAFREEGEKEGAFFYYEKDLVSKLRYKHKMVFVKKLTYHKNGCEKIVVIENDSDSVARALKKIGKEYSMYIAQGDYVLFTNIDDKIYDVADIPQNLGKKYIEDVSVEGSDLQLVIFKPKSFVGNVLRANRWVILALFLFTVLIPYVVLNLIKGSIVSRIWKLQDAFGEDENNTFRAIDDIEGTDEIAQLMYKYNDMVNVTNTLVQTVYKEKLREQETDLARKNAELLALQSQINPHFLFNALESIRMHSLLKGEEETATMVGKLAVMQRQNVEWGCDLVSIAKEMESIEAYLYLQVYRFGERLRFEIDIDDDCRDFQVPKLTIVTFVENACVHGIESKSSQGWIFIRAFKDAGELVIEIEDTGDGMSEEDADRMQQAINQVTIEDIKGKKHVGILNACLRLKMITDHSVRFNIESEEGIGLLFEIRIPLDKLETCEGKENEEC